MAATIGKLSAIEIPEGASLNVAEALAKYDDVFLFSAKLAIGCGVLFLLITPLMKRWMHGVK
jgi:POT family proton-dependent oligopeptide transporter